MLLGDTGDTPTDTTRWEKLVKVLQDEEKWKLIIAESIPINTCYYVGTNNATHEQTKGTSNKTFIAHK